MKRLILFVATDFMLNLYHIEKRRLKKSETYYLKKSIRINDRVYSIRNKIGKEKPTPEKGKILISTPNLSLEKKALDKRIEHSANLYKPKYLESSQIQRLEKTKHWDYFFELFLTKSELEYYRETNRINYVHGTTAIEGNTFSLQQVDELLNRLIRKLHELLMDNIDFESAGRFRRIDSIGIRGVEFAVSPALLIEGELENIIDRYYVNMENGGHPFEEAVLFHYNFELIHPFTDGNGRVGREVLNYMLTETGFPRLIVSKSMREVYINALQQGNKEQYRQMVLAFIEVLEDKRSVVFEEILEGKYN